MQNTIDIKILGTRTSTQAMTSSVIREYLKRGQLSLTVEDHYDIDEFIEEGIESVPAVIYKGQVFNIGTNGNFNASLRTVVSAIMRDHNYGMMDKVMIPVDFSTTSINAFAYGHRLATAAGAVTQALHVYMPSAKELSEAALMEVDLPSLHRSYLDELVAKFDSDWGSDLMRNALIDGVFRTGFPAKEIIDAIKQSAPTLVVMGTTGQTGILRKWFGSVSTTVMNESPKPVLLVPEGATYTPIKRIAYAYDDIELDQKIIAPLGGLADMFGAEIHLIHVEGDEHPDPGYYLKSLFQDEYPSVKIKTHTIYDDDIAEGLTRYCTEYSIDVIATSTHKKGFIERLRDDNISEQLSLFTRIPLLVMKATE